MVKISGVVLLFFGFSIMSFALFGEESFIELFYGIPLVVVGLAIIFNRSEDSIEQINYSKIKK